MQVRVASVLFDYTGGRAELEAEGATPAQVLTDLERRYPGLLFRVVDEQGQLRRHMNLFLDSRACRDLEASLEGVRCLHLLGALSGG